MSKKLLLIIFLILLPVYAWSACVDNEDGTWTSTPDQASVKSCYDQATAGDTINITAGDGDETWATAYTCGNRTAGLCMNKPVKFIGPGAASLTIRNSGDQSYIFIYEPTSAVYAANTAIAVIFRISGLTLDSKGNRSIKLGGSVNTPFAVNVNVRIDNNVFIDSTGTGTSASAIWDFGTLYGVVDNNTFTNLYYPIKHDPSVNMDAFWDSAPQAQFSLGSEKYLYIEDNTFTGALVATADGQYSARYVHRYNTWSLSGVASGTTIQLHDIHGEQPTGNMAACFGAELYGNKYSNTGTNYSRWLYQRSGQVRLFFNQGASSALSAYTGTTSSPCPENHAAEKVIHNTYVWNNRTSATGGLSSVSASADMTCNGLTGIPTFGRDVMTDISSPGITCGTLGTIPATCTIGQGYWATAQSNCTDLTGYVGASADRTSPETFIEGTLYKCTANNVWQKDYEPYTYPHPLREGEAPADVTAPSFYSSAIDATGEILTIVLSEDVAITDNTGFVLTCSGGAAGLTFTSESNGTLLYAIDRAIQRVEGNCSLAYTSVANGIQDAAGNDLATFGGGDEVVVNGSTQETAPFFTLTVTATGGVAVSSPSGINCGSNCNYDYETGTSVVIQGYCLRNYQNPVISGACNASTGAVTMSEARACAYTCTKVSPDAAIGSGATTTIGTGAATTVY